MSQDEIGRKDPETLRIPESALAPQFARGVDAAICGHIHQEGVRASTVHGRERRLYTLKDWCAGAPYLEWREGAFEFRSLTFGS